MRVEFAGIRGGYPLAPYAKSGEQVNLATSPRVICGGSEEHVSSLLSGEQKSIQICLVKHKAVISLHLLN